MNLCGHVIARMCSLLKRLSDNIYCAQPARMQSQVCPNNQMHISVELQEKRESAIRLQDFSLSAFFRSYLDIWLEQGLDNGETND